MTMGTGKVLGYMKPIGGGDPIPLTKGEVIIGRRPSCDIRLEFENVSGRHCSLHYTNGTWHIRDLGSTNGTKVNGAKLSREQGLMPDDELAIASHLFHIDYEPASPLMESHQVLEEEAISPQHRTSLLELAGIDSEDRARPPSARPAAETFPVEPSHRANGGPEPSRPEPADGEKDLQLPDDDEFLRMIADDLR
jgi:pSer/pThr/pTyr-binding forkhead associated (FHA) protein